MNVVVIPARGGSKRIPRKNIRLFCGRPLISYSIVAALASEVVDRVYVSTDDEDIATVARDFGAEVPFTRPATLADDHATTIEVMRHAAGWLSDVGVPAMSICCLYSTPLVRPEDLASGYRRLLGGGWDFVFSAVRHGHPIWRSLSVGSDGATTMLFPQHEGTRSQDLPATWHDAGQFYWGTPQAWLWRQGIFTAHSTIVELPAWRVQDIDQEEDWRRAEIAYGALIRPDCEAKLGETVASG